MNILSRGDVTGSAEARQSLNGTVNLGRDIYVNPEDIRKAVDEYLDRYPIEGTQGPQGEQGPKGDTGEQGPKGDTGYTPVRGTDYFTEKDVSEIAAMAAKLVGAYGGSISVTDDGEGNVTIVTNGPITITDDGDSNVTIR